MIGFLASVLFTSICWISIPFSKENILSNMNQILALFVFVNHWLAQWLRVAAVVCLPIFQWCSAIGGSARQWLNVMFHDLYGFGLGHKTASYLSLHKSLYIYDKGFLKYLWKHTFIFFSVVPWCCYLSTYNNDALETTPGLNHASTIPQTKQVGRGIELWNRDTMVAYRDDPFLDSSGRTPRVHGRRNSYLKNGGWKLFAGCLGR